MHGQKRVCGANSHEILLVSLATRSNFQKSSSFDYSWVMIVHYKKPYIDGSNINSTVSSCSSWLQEANFVERIPFTETNPDKSANLLVAKCAFSDTNARCKPVHRASRLSRVDSVSFPSSKTI
mmetsp:Transcript_23140/g.32412  ORF Transcript_23140/g.32412 Transcript_23140/m.32412 type:complete len:123 (-) Transcript_23140:684-1052(-)